LEPVCNSLGKREELMSIDLEVACPRVAEVSLDSANQRDRRGQWCVPGADCLAGDAHEPCPCRRAGTGAPASRSTEEKIGQHR
jgi:hypothetical protein